MAYTSIWSVKGWLGKVLIYTEDPAKTNNPAYYKKSDMTNEQRQGLDDVIEYASQGRKTQMTDEHGEIKKQFVSGVNCSPGSAREIMFATKKKFASTEGVVAYHGIQSFAAGETTPGVAHEIGVKLAQQLWGNRHEVVVTTHLDKNCLHNHFVVNNVSFVDGKRYYRSKKDYYDMQTESDKLCREYGLSVIEEKKPGQSKHYSEWSADKSGQPTYRNIVKTDIDAAIREAVSERQFWEFLKEKGYQFKFGQDITAKPAGRSRGIKLARAFGEEYTIERIRERIIETPIPQRKKAYNPRAARRVRLAKGKLKTRRKMTGLRALYFYYLYRLGVFSKKKPEPPKPKPKSSKQVYFLYREQIRSIRKISEEAQFLARNRIDTIKQLDAHNASSSKAMDGLIEQRQQLRNRIRHMDDKEEKAAAWEGVRALSAQIKPLRKEVRLCSNIERRSCTIQEAIRKERGHSETKQGKGVKEHGRS